MFREARDAQSHFNLRAGLDRAIAHAYAKRGAKVALLARNPEAITVIQESMNTPDGGIPKEIISHATCVGVIPIVKKGAFIVGASYGQGVVTCKSDHGWSAPVFIRLAGASYGFQIGGKETDVILIAVTTRASRIC